MRLFAILRGDICMSEGKANAQAGHAYVDALLHALHHPHSDARERARAYAGLRPGTKICLDGGSPTDFDRLLAELQAREIPHVLIHDQGHVELPDFDGSRIVTAIGVGPLHRDERPRSLKRLSMWKGGRRARLLAASATPNPQKEICDAD